MNATTSPQTASLVIEGGMTIYSAAELKQRLLDALIAADSLELNLADVDEMDTAGLQVLLLAKRESLAAGKRLDIAAHSSAVREVIGFFNMDAYFGDQVVIPAEEER